MTPKLKTIGIFLISCALFGATYAARHMAFGKKPGSGQGMVPEPTGEAGTRHGPSAHADPSPTHEPRARDDGRRVQLALLLDTSSSMDGLIDQARSQLWKVVNSLASTRHGDKAPALELALFEYGNDGLPADSGHLRVVVPFTTDLDLVSEHLFALSTNGGSEFVGQVVEAAVERLEWSKSGDDLKMIFVAGNEGFDQGTVAPEAAIRKASQRGIAVNTVYCGAASDFVAAGWKAGASLADGRFLAIDQNQRIAAIDAPQDREIAALSAELNDTYVAYGRDGARGRKRQVEQDVNASAVGQGAAPQRALSKAKINYFNPTWDLVDGVDSKSVDLEALEEASLPQEMRGLSGGERMAYVAKKGARRAEIKARLTKLGEDRAEYVREKSKASASTSTLDEAMQSAVRQQAEKKGYAF